MGLDVYGNRIKRATVNKIDSSNWKEVSNASEKEYKATLRRALNRVGKVLKNTDADTYAETYTKQMKSLCKYFSYPEFQLDSLGYRFNYQTNEYEITPLSIDAFNEAKEKVLTRYYGKSEFYFRKVNFFYRYFQPKLVDEIAWVTKDDVLDIIDRCSKVLKNHKLAPELLPTQGGFFFGSTEYDKYYFIDVKYCKKQMKSILGLFDKGYDMYVVMSW